MEGFCRSSTNPIIMYIFGDTDDHICKYVAILANGQVSTIFDHFVDANMYILKLCNTKHSSSK